MLSIWYVSAEPITTFIEPVGERDVSLCSQHVDEG